MNRVIFQCEDSMEGILTGVYDAWASRVGHDRVKLEAGPDHEMELFSEYRRVETDGEKAEKVADEIIKNTYRTLMTRGQKGCYIYCTDKKLSDYLKDIL